MLIHALLIASVTLLVSCSTATAHSWYPSDCCSGKDCIPVGCEGFMSLPNGNLAYHDLEFSPDKLRASPNEDCHICVAIPEDTKYPPYVICAFKPVRSA